jgi:hypothetical protein
MIGANAKLLHIVMVLNKVNMFTSSCDCHDCNLDYIGHTLLYVHLFNLLYPCAHIFTTIKGTH